MPSASLKEDYGDIVQRLAQQRDELRLQAHLFGLEAKQQWDKAEQQWEHLRAKTKVIGAEASHGGGEIKESLEVVLEDVGADYERLRR